MAFGDRASERPMEHIPQLWLGNLQNAIRAIASTDDELRAHPLPYSSIERIVVDEFDDAVFICREFERTGSSMLSAEIRAELAGLEAAVVRVMGIIYGPESAYSEAAFAAAWADARACACALLGRVGWEGPVDWRQFES